MADFGEIAAKQRQVVAFVQAAQPPQGVGRRLVIKMGHYGVAGIGGHSHQASVAEPMSRLLQQTRLRVIRMNREMDRHGFILALLAPLRRNNMRMGNSRESRNIEDRRSGGPRLGGRGSIGIGTRSEEHTSELQSRENLVCRLQLETKNTNDGPS